VLLSRLTSSQLWRFAAGRLASHAGEARSSGVGDASPSSSSRISTTQTTPDAKAIALLDGIDASMSYFAFMYGFDPKALVAPS
jgi:hypothetical protein